MVFYSLSFLPNMPQPSTIVDPLLKGVYPYI